MLENCLLISAGGTVKKIYVDLSNYKNIAAAIDSEGINIIATAGMRALTERVNSPKQIVGYCDRNGYYTDKDENTLIQRISGYDVIIGDVLLCAVDEKFREESIDPIVLDRLCNMLK